MTKLELPGPGLDDEQWDRLRALATSLTPEQSTWVGGYFTGFGEGSRMGLGVPASAGSPASSSRTLTVLYGSETGIGAAMAKQIAAEAVALGIGAKAIDMAEYRPASLKQEQDLLCIASTHGEGEPPLPALGFFEFLDGRKAPRLEGIRFAVLALGDSTYEFFCGAGKRLDERLATLGAQRLVERIDCDVDQMPAGWNWARGLLERLAVAEAAPRARVEVMIASAAAAVDEQNPFMASVLDNVVITGRGSSRQARHIELDLTGSGLVYEPGDALGILARNDSEVVSQLLDTLALDGAISVTVDGAMQSLEASLTSNFEIACATPRFLEHWARITGANSLVEMGTAERLAYLEGNHVIDIARQYPAKGLDAADLLAGLRRLQPRLYSIASSQAAQDGDVHLTVSRVRYDLHGSERLGVVSGRLGRIKEDAVLPVYIKPNPHFRQPTDDVPIIMVGAGTGVAPFRAFVQERERRGASGKSWLFFGDRNFRSDFLYQSEWQAHLKSGVLTQMDVAFSRDAGGRAYVQQRLREGQTRSMAGWKKAPISTYAATPRAWRPMCMRRWSSSWLSSARAALKQQRIMCGTCNGRGATRGMSIDVRRHHRSQRRPVAAAGAARLRRKPQGQQQPTQGHHRAEPARPHYRRGQRE
jgi:sulfite reductase (NADPH) flavoprotein alpha-component